MTCPTCETCPVELRRSDSRKGHYFVATYHGLALYCSADAELVRDIMRKQGETPCSTE